MRVFTYTGQSISERCRKQYAYSDRGHEVPKLQTGGLFPQSTAESRMEGVVFPPLQQQCYPNSLVILPCRQHHQVRTSHEEEVRNSACTRIGQWAPSGLKEPIFCAVIGQWLGYLHGTPLSSSILLPPRIRALPLANHDINPLKGIHGN